MFFKSTPSSSVRFYPAPKLETEQRAALIVDDHPAIRMAVRSVLSRLEMIGQIIEAGDGHDALDKAKKYRPALVILDLNLSGVDGLNLIRHFSMSNIHSKYLVYSGLDEHIYASRAKKAGANGFISKACGLEMIESVSRSILNGIDCFPVGVHHTDDQPQQNPMALLSNREITILSYLVKGMQNKAIAEKLFIDAKTVSTYKNRILKKTKAKNIVDLIYLYQENKKIL
jgi:DNA-binding NarL/FixJ family response regulator